MFAAEGAGRVGRGERCVPDQHNVFGDGVGIGLFRVPGRGVMERKQGTGDLVGPAPGVGSVGGGVVISNKATQLPIPDQLSQIGEWMTIFGHGWTRASLEAVPLTVEQG